MTSLPAAALPVATDLLEAADALAELLIEPRPLAERLPEALRSMLGTVGLTTAALLVAGGQPGQMELLESGPLPAGWADALAPGGQLHAHVTTLLAAGQPTGASPALGAQVVALTARQKCVGALLFPADAAQPRQLEQLAYLGRVVARAIAVHGEPENTDAWHKLAQLHKIAGALTSSVHLDRVLAATVDGIRTILAAEAVSLVLQDQEQGDLIFKKTLTNETDWIVQQRSRLGRSLIGACLEDGRPLRVNEATADPRFDAELDGVPGLALRSVLCMPLRQDGQTLGVVQVCNKRFGDFGELDVELLSSMAVLVANSLHNAQLFHRLTVANAALETSRWEVLRSRSTLQALFDGITSPIYIVDGDYRLVAVNRTCAEQTNTAAYDLLGQRCHEVLRDQPQPCAGCLMAATRHTGQRQFRLERRWPSPEAGGGEPSEWEVTCYPILDEQQRTSQVIMFEQDVTDKARLEASLAQSAKLAAVGQLAAGVAHEINNPLTAIIANTQLLQREFAEGDDRREALDLIALASERAQRVVRGLLDSARRDQYEPKAVDIAESLNGALSLLWPELRARAIEVTTELPEGLPAVMGSADHLQGVWLNLLLNARDAVSGQNDVIQVSAARHGAEVHVTVADNGGGIPAESLTRIFEPFYTTKGPGQGTDLGLAVVQRVVKQHGGRIQVESSAGHGTAFTVILPSSSL